MIVVAIIATIGIWACAAALTAIAVNLGDINDKIREPIGRG